MTTETTSAQTANLQEPNEYTKGIVRENGVLLNRYIFEGYKNWETGKLMTAQRKIKTGDVVRLTFLGAKEEEIRVKDWNAMLEMYDSITVMGENYYFEVVVNEKRSYYGKYVTYRYTEDTGERYPVKRTCIDEAEVRKAFTAFKAWLCEGAKENNFWHGLYKKNEFSETIAYGMPGEENVTVPAEKTWKTGEVIDEGDGLFTVDGIRYELYDDYEYKDDKRVNFKALRILPLKDLDKYSGTIDIPSKVKYRSRWREVMEIGSATFCDCPELIELRLPESITSFHQIWGSPKLARVIVAEGNAKYASVDGVVYNKEMTEMVCYPHAHGRTYHVPDTITSIWGFAGCTMLEEIVIPETVKRIGSWNDNSRLGVFEGCVNLKSIHIPGSIEWIRKDTFKNCTGLKRVSFGEGTKCIEYCAFNGCTSLKEIVFPDSIEDVNRDAFYGCKNVEHIVFPKGRFFDLGSVPENLLPWGKDPFEIDGILYTPHLDKKEDIHVVIWTPEPTAPAPTQHPQVEELHIPATVEKYGFTYEVRQCKCDFRQFPNLRSLHLPSTVNSIKISGISSLQEVVIDEDNPTYASIDGLLYNKDMTELIAVPIDLSIKKFVVRDGVEIIGEGVLAGNPQLEEVVFPDSVKKVNCDAFSDCLSLKTVHLNEGLEHLDTYAFGNTALEKVKLPHSLKYIGQRQFSGLRPFSKCNRLTAFEMEGENDLFVTIDGVLYKKNNSGLTLLYCPSGLTGALHIPDGVNCISHDACKYCNNLEEVVMPDSVTKIGEYAFSCCKNLKQVILSKKVSSIDHSAFRECTALKELDLTVCEPDFPLEVDVNAFFRCPDLVLKLPCDLEKERKYFESNMKDKY